MESGGGEQPDRPLVLPRVQSLFALQFSPCIGQVVFAPFISSFAIWPSHPLSFGSLCFPFISKMENLVCAPLHHDFQSRSFVSRSGPGDITTLVLHFCGRIGGLPKSCAVHYKRWNRRAMTPHRSHNQICRVRMDRSKVSEL